MSGAWAAIENFSRCLAHEIGPKGVRVVCLRAGAMPETPQIHEVFGIHAKTTSITYEQFEESSRARTFTHRLPKLVDIASAATFVASNEAVTAAVVNLSSGMITD
jgi:NAD(P)-dependent dehydrogenase (short-subunit alcohol dehydrogenase family)